MPSLRNLLFSFACAALTMGCETSVNLPFPDHTPRLVVFADLEPGAPVQVYVARSHGLNERIKPGDLIIRDAKVELLANGVLVETIAFKDSVIEYPFGFSDLDTLRLDAGRYSARFTPPNAPAVYTVRVSHPDFETATGVAPLAAPPVITGIEVRQRFFTVTDPFDPTFTISAGRVRVQLADNGAEANAYIFDFAAALLNPETGDTIMAALDYPLYPVTLSGGRFQAAETQYVLDTAWNGRTVNIDFLVTDFAYIISGAGVDSLDWKEFTVRAMAITPEEVAFETKRRQQRSGEIDFFPPEPVVVRGNVTGGYGLISTRSKGALTVRR